MISTVLFDLDGTLLPMDNDEFTRGYFAMLAKKLAPRGYDAGELVKNIWAGVAAMVQNDGSRTNEAAFWEVFRRAYGAERNAADRPLIEEFYENEFRSARVFCGFNPMAAETVALARRLGCRVALATNPLFPRVATLTRIGWAGLDAGDFELITTYEDSTHCKPNLEYYRDVMRALGVEAGECLMVGNDAGEDMVCGELGAKTFLLTDCLINRDGAPLDSWPHGGFTELQAYLRALRG